MGGCLTRAVKALAVGFRLQRYFSRLGEARYHSIMGVLSAIEYRLARIKGTPPGIRGPGPGTIRAWFPLRFSLARGLPAWDIVSSILESFNSEVGMTLSKYFISLK